jgi:hypothetical protein
VPGNPHECRLNAVYCSQLAEAAATPELRRTFDAMADKWKMLAAEFEAAQSLLRTMSEMEFGTPSQSCEPYEALPSALRLRSAA